MQDERIQEMHEKIRNLRDELRQCADETSNDQAAALCETSCEAIGGLEKAFDHYLNKSEKAWR